MKSPPQSRRSSACKATFLEDGDTLTLKVYGEEPGAGRIGMGSVSGTIAPAA